MELIKSILKNRKLIRFLSKDDIKKRYAGSVLGIVWAFVQPCVTIVIYWFVFEMGLKSISPAGYENIPFIVYIMCGLIPWFFFSEALSSVTSVFVEYSYLVKKVVFDIEVLPIIKLISSLLIHLFFIVLLFTVMALFGIFPGWPIIQAFYYTICMIALVLALGYFTSSLVVFFRDLAQVVQVILQAGMWITPILWPFSMLDGKWFAIIFKLNPMFYIVQGYRESLLHGDWFFNHIGLTLYFWGFVFVVAFIGKRVYKRMKPHFSDVL